MTRSPDMYRFHRGGSGAVVLVIALCCGEERIAVFGSIEMAQAWREGLGDDYSAVFAPAIVDDPDWGNERDG